MLEAYPLRYVEDFGEPRTKLGKWRVLAYLLTGRVEWNLFQHRLIGHLSRSGILPHLV